MNTEPSYTLNPNARATPSRLLDGAIRKPLIRILVAPSDRTSPIQATAHKKYKYSYLQHCQCWPSAGIMQLALFLRVPRSADVLYRNDNRQVQASGEKLVMGKYRYMLQYHRHGLLCTASPCPCPINSQARLSSKTIFRSLFGDLRRYRETLAQIPHQEVEVSVEHVEREREFQNKPLIRRCSRSRFSDVMFAKVW